ncbi:hypothetical protein [Lelliottia wanjuensis]|uniref:hypothetical protein n=1 Tax=Lelliottia wanjuensis TaxID=3050585 RepID=UPI00254CF5DF|nr:hypothetical protein [Lelliottia sp. V86_10]MDK9586718.1 hypothetical protein [Lelliottia sp. V86_10]
MKTLIQQSQQACNRIHTGLAHEYVRRFSSVSDAQLQRFERAMSKLMKQHEGAVYAALWLDAEGELVARSFEAM